MAGKTSPAEHNDPAANIIASGVVTRLAVKRAYNGVSSGAVPHIQHLLRSTEA